MLSVIKSDDYDEIPVWLTKEWWDKTNKLFIADLQKKIEELDKNKNFNDKFTFENTLNYNTNTTKHTISPHLKSIIKNFKEIFYNLKCLFGFKSK